MKTATAVKGAIVIAGQSEMNGLRFAEVDVNGWAEVKKLPKVILLDGYEYAMTGWNSDRNVAYYRTGAAIGRAI